MNPFRWLCLGGIRVYQWVLSPLKLALLGPSAKCRFTPSCSHYAMEAIRRHGVWRGGCMSFRRLLRCHPWGESGWDPVPEQADWCVGKGSGNRGVGAGVRR